jgi:hypothetical protein
MNFIRDPLSAYVEVMVFASTRLRVRHWGEAAVMGLILIVAAGVVFVCDRWLKKHRLSFAAGALVSFLVLGMVVGGMGLLLSLPRLPSSLRDTFPVVCVGSPAFILTLGLLISFGSRLRHRRPIAGVGILLWAWLFSAYFFFVTFIVFFRYLVVS